MNKTRKASPARANARCAIYTRKSTEEGLEQEFKPVATAGYLPECRVRLKMATYGRLWPTKTG
jgi:hypothetical protein